MEKVKATAIAVEPAVSRTNQNFWRVKLNTGDTLYTYQQSTIANLVLNQEMVFDLEQKGRYFHIAGVSPIGGAMATQEQTYVPINEDGYPESFDQKTNQALKAIATPQAPAAGFTQSHSQTPPWKGGGGQSWKSGGKGGGSNESYALSYAKDIVVAMIAQGVESAVDAWVQLAEQGYNWMESKK